MNAWLRYFLAAVLLVLLGYGFLSVWLGTPSFLATVTSDSMKPALERGDWVVLEKRLDYGLNDTIVFFLNPGNVYVHRVVALAPASSGNVGYRTKGDANPGADGWIVPSEAVLGRVVVRIPRLGYLALWLSGR